MDYEKAYKESFEAAKGLHDAGNALTKKQMEIVFPQLAESEDKRIARAINNMLPFIPDEAYANNGVTKEDVLTWIEKKKEQKPTEINFKALLTADRLASAEMTGRLKERSEILENPEKYGLCKSAKWSKEDEETLKDIIAGLEATKQLIYKHEPSGRACYNRWIDWLKSLRSRPKSSDNWKPSEEQMKALLKAVDKARELHYSSNSGYDEYDVLRLLYGQLKKL